eukprot:1314864-Amorphochlora_amoeboformis.AAC.1
MRLVRRRTHSYRNHLNNEKISIRTRLRRQPHGVASSRDLAIPGGNRNGLEKAKSWRSHVSTREDKKAEISIREDFESEVGEDFESSVGVSRGVMGAEGRFSWASETLVSSPPGACMAPGGAWEGVR